MNLPTNARLGDIITILEKTRRDIKMSYSRAYDHPWVTEESWNRDPHGAIFFKKDKIPALKAAGLMKKPEDYNYGYHFPNEYLAKLRKGFKEIEDLLDEICSYLDGFTLRPKVRYYSDVELRRFTIIEGGGELSWIASMLKEGVLND